MANFIKEQVSCTQIILKYQSSYGLNNLTSTANYLAYYSYQNLPRVIVMETKLDQLNQETVIILNQNSVFSELKYINLEQKNVLVILTSNCIQIYSENGQKLLYTYQSDESNNYFIGIENIYDNLIIGKSKNLFIIESLLQNQNECLNQIDVQKQISHILKIPTQDLFVVADIFGKLYFYNIISNKIEQKSIKQVNTNDSQYPITCLKLLEAKQKSKDNTNYLVIGDYVGKITIYELDKFEILLTINAHSRMITCLDTNIDQMEFISGSEDTYYNYWKIDQSPKININLKVSFRIADFMIVGARFLEGSNQTIVTLNESSTLQLLKTTQN